MCMKPLVHLHLTEWLFNKLHLNTTTFFLIYGQSYRHSKLSRWRLILSPVGWEVALMIANELVSPFDTTTLLSLSYTGSLPISQYDDTHVAIISLSTSTQVIISNALRGLFFSFEQCGPVFQCLSCINNSQANPWDIIPDSGENPDSQHDIHGKNLSLLF